MYVKLFGSILDSSIWAEDLPTRIVWITMLAMADQEGIVQASTSGLSRRACVTPQQCRHALDVLQSPDVESKSQEYAGRRIEAVDGGWILLNYQKYRELRTRQQVADAIRQKRSRKRTRDKSRRTVTRPKVTTEADAVSDADAKAKAVRPKIATPAAGGWVAKVFTIWSQHGGSIPPGRLGKALKAAREEVADDERLAYGLGKWLAAGNAKYGPEVFARDWRKWVPGGRNGTPDAADLDLAEWVAEQEAKDAP